jgi:D-arabinose 1-dehydrogenase-like Zn-dependent alcohol dehydrogenase
MKAAQIVERGDVCAETGRDSPESLAKGGRPVTCGATTGPNPETDVDRTWNQPAVIGSTMATPGQFDDALELVRDGTFEPRIRETLPTGTARAHELLETGEWFGTGVVVPDSER